MMFLSAQNLHHRIYATAENFVFMIGWKESKFLMSESAAVTWDLGLNEAESQLQNMEHILDLDSGGISGNSDLSQ